MFVPPTVGEDGWAGLMSCYRAGHDLGWGVRIVAAHRDGRLILYNVPADLFNYVQALRSSMDTWDEGAGVMAQSDLLMDDVLSAHPNTSTNSDLERVPSNLDPDTPLRTVRIEGVEIGHVGRDIVDDVTVDTTNGGVRVWVFCRSGIARLLDLYINLDHEVRQRFVGNDGLVYDSLQSSSPHSEEGRRSPKGKGRAQSEDNDTTVLRKTMGLDGVHEQEDEPQPLPRTRAASEQPSDCRRSHPSRRRRAARPQVLHLEILASNVPQMETEGEGPFEIEILTDWPRRVLVCTLCSHLELG